MSVTAGESFYVLGSTAAEHARLLGPSGTVLGADQDSTALQEARVSLAEAGFDNVTFVTPASDSLAPGRTRLED